MAGGMVKLALLGLCLLLGALSCQARQLPAGEVQGPDNDLCQMCHDVALQAEVFFTDPVALNQTVDFLEATACSSLPQGMGVQCKELVEEYVPALFATMQTELNPDILCVKMGACRPGPPPPPLVALKPRNREHCALCQIFAADFLSYLESNQTQANLLAAAHHACSHLKRPDAVDQCNLMVDQYGSDVLDMLQSLSPHEVCDLLKQCDSSYQSPRVEDSVKALTSDNCAMCHFLVFEARAKLKRPETQLEVEQFLEETCQKVPNHEAECKGMVAEYAPLVFENLDSILDPKVICEKVKACKRSRNESIIRMATNAEVAAK